MRKTGTLVLVATPLLVAAVDLLCEGLGRDRLHASLRLVALLGLVAVPSLLTLTARGRGPAALASRIVAAPALLAPLAVCFPWTVAPSHLGVAFGEFAFFLHWLTKYPDWGSVNREVLLGILCVLGCAFLPWLAAVLHLRRRGGRVAGMGLLGLVLIPYAPVLIQLDLGLFLVGTFGAKLIMGVRPPIWVVFGSVLRLASILSMIGMLVSGRRAAPEGGAAA